MDWRKDNKKPAQFNAVFRVDSLYKNYPLIIKPINIKENQVEFDEELTKIWFDRQDKRALNEFCKDLNIVKYDLANIDEKFKEDIQFLNYIHLLLHFDLLFLVFETILPLSQMIILLLKST